MSIGLLDKDLALPLYHQLQNVLKAEIESGRWRPDERLPSEQEIAERSWVWVEISELCNRETPGRHIRRPTTSSSPRLCRGGRFSKSDRKSTRLNSSHLGIS